jgi:hypothetical protein
MTSKTRGCIFKSRKHSVREVAVITIENDTPIKTKSRNTDLILNELVRTVHGSIVKEYECSINCIADAYVFKLDILRGPSLLIRVENYLLTSSYIYMEAAEFNRQFKTFFQIKIYDSYGVMKTVRNSVCSWLSLYLEGKIFTTGSEDIQHTIKDCIEYMSDKTDFTVSIEQKDDSKIEVIDAQEYKVHMYYIKFKRDDHTHSSIYIEHCKRDYMHVVRGFVEVPDVDTKQEKLFEFKAEDNQSLSLASCVLENYVFANL